MYQLIFIAFMYFFLNCTTQDLSEHSTKFKGLVPSKTYII